MLVYPKLMDSETIRQTLIKVSQNLRTDLEKVGLYMGKMGDATPPSILYNSSCFQFIEKKKKHFYFVPVSPIMQECTPGCSFSSSNPYKNKKKISTLVRKINRNLRRCMLCFYIYIRNLGSQSSRILFTISLAPQFSLVSCFL